MPPQSFIGSYCPLTQIQYASIDCVEMQSGSPQQKSKQSKFNKTPPPVCSLPLKAPPIKEQMYLCVRDRVEDLSQLFLDAKKPERRQKVDIQEVTSALNSLPAKWTKENMF